MKNTIGDPKRWLGFRDARAPSIVALCFLGLIAGSVSATTPSQQPAPSRGPETLDLPGLGERFWQYGAYVRISDDGIAEIHLAVGDQIIIARNSAEARAIIAKFAEIGTAAETPMEKALISRTLEIANRTVEMGDELLRLDPKKDTGSRD